MMQYNKSFAFNSTEPVTANQLNYLKILNYNENPPKTKGEASLLITDRLYQWRPKSPTEPQLAYLGTLGYRGSPPKTRGEAADLIRDRIQQRGDKLTYDDIPHVIYGVKIWREGDPFAHIHEHSDNFYTVKELRESGLL